jgi:hypothetical protein
MAFFLKNASAARRQPLNTSAGGFEIAAEIPRCDEDVTGITQEIRLHPVFSSMIDLFSL